jgi:hypothetical protein
MLELPHLCLKARELKAAVGFVLNEMCSAIFNYNDGTFMITSHIGTRQLLDTSNIIIGDIIGIHKLQILPYQGYKS